MTVLAFVDIEVITDQAQIERGQSPAGKPFLRLKMVDGTTIDITTNLAEMIGGVGAGVRKRFEDRSKN